MRSSLIVLAAALLACAPPAFAARLDEAVALLDDGWGARAEAMLEEITAREPGRAEAWHQLAWARFHARDFEAAEEYAEKSLELEPDNPDFLVLRGHAAGRRAQTGSKLKAMGRAKTCRRHYEAALARDPGHVEGNLSLIQFLLEAPGIAGGDKDRARELAFALEEYDPVEAHIMQGMVHEKFEDPDAALAAYRRAVDLSRETGRKEDRALWAYLNTCYQYDRPETARALLDELVTDPGREAAVRTALAGHYQRTGDLEAARAAWIALAAADSTRFGALMNLGHLEAGREDWAAAAAHFDAAHAAEPENRQALYQASRVRLIGEIELERSIAGFQEYLAAEINLRWPAAGWARVRMAEAMWKNDDETAARKELSRLKKTKPRDDRLKKQIKDLEEAMNARWDY
jgi:tetratricopeptide (TPR) repeat protein